MQISSAAVYFLHLLLLFVCFYHLASYFAAANLALAKQTRCFCLATVAASLSSGIMRNITLFRHKQLCCPVKNNTVYECYR